MFWVTVTEEQKLLLQSLKVPDCLVYCDGKNSEEISYVKIF